MSELETARQIEDSEGVHDIEAPKIVPENEYILKKAKINNAGNAAVIDFNHTDETHGGVIEFNTKGNLSIESLEKHVNIEAKKGVQLKPTTNVTFDSGRRIFNNKGNEVHLQFVFDDYADYTAEGNTGTYPGDDEPYSELKVEARTIDLRCYDHGGVAIQPCGTDSNGVENKIKFESSRTSPLGETGTVSYAKEGGKGLEFGTFNNEHSSLFTKDYRFNASGMVYAVTRGIPTTSGGKTDYPTQRDDFKDIIDENLGVSWENIVKTAKVFAQLSLVSNPSVTDLMSCFNSVFNPSNESQQ